MLSLLILSTLATLILLIFFFFNDTATTEIYTLSLHDALPILRVAHVDVRVGREVGRQCEAQQALVLVVVDLRADRKSTRLNSSHSQISYAVFSLKKKNDLLPSSHRSCSIPYPYSLR